MVCFSELQYVLKILTGLVAEHISKLPFHQIPNEILGALNYGNIPELRFFFRKLVSHGQELKVFFTVPNQQIMSKLTTSTLNRNEVVAAFINLYLLMVEAILCFEEDSIACVKGPFQNLQTELGFLTTFLGDTSMHLQPTKDILTDIEAVVNEVGSFFYSFFFTMVVSMLWLMIGVTNDEPVDIETMVSEVRSSLHSDLFESYLKGTYHDEAIRLEEQFGHNSEFEETLKIMSDIKPLVQKVRSFIDFFTFTKDGILDLALSNLLRTFQPLNKKIKKHCVAVSEIPSNMAQKAYMGSPYIVDSILDDLMYLINDKPEKIAGADDQIVKLHEELMLLGSSIAEIAMQQEGEVEELITRSRDVAYEVEFLINSFPPDWYLTLRLPQLIEKIQLLTTAIKEMKKNIDAAGRLEVAKYPVEQVSSRSKVPSDLENIVVGLDNVVIEIAENLVEGTDQLQIISIFGMPGLGKTTLANKLYHHPSIVYHFYKRAWCVISQTYNKKNVLLDILSSLKNLKRETIMNMDDESLGEDLYKSLKRMRYLIVIDDIWDTEPWEDLKRYFPDDEYGSRILFTTRNKKVGFEASPHSVIRELPFLSDAECWELLQRKVFQDENCPQELIDIGEQIATNCHGLPLAVVVIAGVLANMEKKKHLWKNIARSLSSHISENRDNCIQILELSFMHLPMPLKPCFLYFAAFEEDVEIPVRKLMSLWVAEGYIKKEEQKCLEDVALEYLMELIDRSLVLVAKRRFDGRVKSCKIHDLLRDMCWKIAEGKNFLKVVKFNDDEHEGPLKFFKQVSMYQQHHFLSINYPSARIYSLPFGLHLRSLLCVAKFHISILCSYKVLKVLDFYNRSNQHVLIGVKHLFHLRYLAVSCTLPPILENFHKLEFLDVNNSDPIEIPGLLLNMMSLRHVHFRGGAYFSASCHQQATTDEGFLRNNNLQSISVLSVSDEIDEKILRCSPNLRRLKGRLGSSLNYSFDYLNKLESLKLSPDYKKEGKSCSSLIILPSNLKKLTLVDVHVSLKQMEIIGRLQYLEVLNLEMVAFEGGQWDTSEVEFPQLKFLKLDGVQIAEWNASSDNFPTLQRLVLLYCDRLKMIPLSFSYILTLQMIEVFACSQGVKESAKQIQEEQQDYGNEELKVLISNY